MRASITSGNPWAMTEVTILYTVRLGPRRRVNQVSIAGNHYFSTATLMDLLSVHAADVLDRHGVYSQALVSADVSALENVYRNNGFSQVKVTPETSTPETAAEPQAGVAAPQPAGRAYGSAQGRLSHRQRAGNFASGPCSWKATITSPRRL